VIERALQDGPIAIPKQHRPVSGGSQSLGRAASGREDPGGLGIQARAPIIRPAGSEGRKAPEPRLPRSLQPRPVEPEPKPEPKPAGESNKPEQRPAGSEVDVNTQGSWTSYEIGDRIWLSIASVHGGGRTLMGSKFSPEATSDYVGSCSLPGDQGRAFDLP